MPEVPLIVSVVPTVKLVLVCKLPAVELMTPTPTPPATKVLPPTLNAPLTVVEPVIANVVPVALPNKKLPVRVVEARKFEESELKAPLMVVEPVTAKLPLVVAEPVINELPATDSAANGEVVPMPTLPPFAFNTRFLLPTFVCVA